MFVYQLIPKINRPRLVNFVVDYSFLAVEVFRILLGPSYYFRKLPIKTKTGNFRCCSRHFLVKVFQILSRTEVCLSINSGNYRPRLVNFVVDLSFLAFEVFRILLRTVLLYPEITDQNQNR